MLDGFSMPGSSMMDDTQQPNPFPVDLNTYLSNALGVMVQFQAIPEDNEVWPVITYALVDGDSDLQLDNPSGIQNDLWQFVAYSTNPVDCAVGTDAVRNVLHGYSGLMGSTTVLTCNRHRVYSGRANTVSSDDTPLHKIISEYTIIYRQPVVTFL